MPAAQPSLNKLAPTCCSPSRPAPFRARPDALPYTWVNQRRGRLIAIAFHRGQRYFESENFGRQSLLRDDLPKQRIHGRFRGTRELTGSRVFLLQVRDEALAGRGGFLKRVEAGSHDAVNRILMAQAERGAE